MRRLLRDVAENRELGDVTTLTDSSVMDLIQAKLPARAQRGLTRPGLRATAERGTRRTDAPGAPFA